jgi:hypothetical protein
MEEIKQIIVSTNGATKLYKEPQFTLDDIQDGDICVWEDGETFKMEDYWRTRYNQDLTHIHEIGYNIKEVLRPQTIYKAPELTKGQQMLIDCGGFTYEEGWIEDDGFKEIDVEVYINEENNELKFYSSKIETEFLCEDVVTKKLRKAILTRLEELESE